jgi:hypothetical protein
LKGEIGLFHIPSNEQIADILTKFWKNEVPRLQKYARGSGSCLKTKLGRTIQSVLIVVHTGCVRMC